MRRVIAALLITAVLLWAGVVMSQSTTINGRAIIYIEPDDQYTLIVLSNNTLKSSSSNLTLTNAFNAARDSLSVLATGTLKHRRITLSTTVN